MPILFELEFDLRSATRERYEQFINELRERLADTYSLGRPVLARQEPLVPTRFFDVVLRTSSHSVGVRFRFRVDNLYLIGYQMVSGQWFEFSHDESKKKSEISKSKGKKNKSKSNSNDGCAVHWITEPRTDFLGFSCGYGKLANTAGRDLNQIRISYQSLVHAVDQLAESTDWANRAHRLIVVIFSISESARLIPIFEHIANSFPDLPGTRGREGGLIETWVQRLAQGWDKMCSAVLRHNGCRREQTILLEDSNITIPPDHRVIRTVADMLTIIGIILCINTTVSKRSRHRRSITSGSEMCFWGSLLVQVFSVCIDNIDNEDPGDLYGAITIDNGLYTEYIYNRSSDKPESIKPGEFATLTGPSKAMSALGSFTIKLLLNDKDTFLSIDFLNPDDLIVDDVISWEDDAYYSNLYDELISCQLHSNRGAVTVNYAVLTDAVAAQVSITLEEGGEDSCQVYGHASLSYDSWDHDSTNNCLLFETTSSNYVEVPRWQLIPLLRSVFAVPLDTCLDLDVCLYDHDIISADDLIAKGIVKLSPPGQIPSTTYNKITGEDGNYVTVTTRWTFAV